MRLIDADALRKAIEDDAEAVGPGYGSRWHFIHTINDAPTIDPFKDKSLEQLMDECFNRGYQKAVKHGRWIPLYDGVWTCSVCEEGFDFYFKSQGAVSAYCPNCGARMDGGDNEID